MPLKFNTTFVLVALFAAFWFSCEQKKAPAPPQDPDSFEAFYQRFHEDTAFQMSRITFPLEGIPAFADSTQMYGGDFRWLRENWVPHRITDSLMQNFDREFVQLGDDLIIEYMNHKSAGIGMERRFGYLGDGWNLIYYAGMNYTNRKDQ